MNSRPTPIPVDELVRIRLRAIRKHRGWSLDDLANRSGVGASTISRIETGNRSISLDVVLPLSRELGVTVDELVASEDSSDVVIRPSPITHKGLTVWPLSKPGSQMEAFRVQIEPLDKPPEPQIHPGYDWLFVVNGVIRLTLGERQILITTGESAEFSTMTPHAFAAVDKPAEVITLLNRDGVRAHMTG